MRIPNNTIHSSHLRTYGITEIPGDVELDFGGCPMLYKATYDEKTLVEPSSAVMDHGSLLHDALYIADETGLPLLPDALDAAVARVVKLGPYPEDAMPVGPEMYEEARDDLQTFIDRGGLSDLVPIAAEQHLTAPLMEYGGEEYMIGGTIDSLRVREDEPETLYVVDYKGRRSPPSQENVDKDAQFTHYGLLVKKNLDRYLPHVDPQDVRIVVVMAAIKWYDLFSPRADWQLDMYEDWLKAMVRRIVDDTEGRPILNDSCSSCVLKFDCPEFAKLPGSGDTLIGRMSSTTTLEQRVLVMQEAQATAKACKGVVDSVQAELKQVVKSGDLVVNGIRYEEADKWETEYDTSKLLDELGEIDFLSVIGSPTADALKALVKKKPELKEKVEAATSKWPRGKRLKYGKDKGEQSEED